ncbi:MAG: SDR family oxidoreductase [Nocardioides sp.]
MDLGLTDRVFIVTGGGRGLGLATAQVLVDEGACVVVSGRSEESLAEATIDLGEHAISVVADNAHPATPGRLLKAANERWGRVDGALISVGGPPPGAALTVDDADWTRAFESVFLGSVRLTREIAQSLSEGGSIALVLSSSVRESVPGLAVSNGLRPGLAMVAKMMADELGPRGIRVNGLLPGRVATGRVAELDAMGGDPDGARERATAKIPLGRYGEPAEFGRAATFLLSPAASFLTGVMLPVDGGMLRSL